MSTSILFYSIELSNSLIFILQLKIPSIINYNLFINMIHTTFFNNFNLKFFEKKKRNNSFICFFVSI